MKKFNLSKLLTIVEERETLNSKLKSYSLPSMVINDDEIKVVEKSADLKNVTENW